MDFTGRIVDMNNSYLTGKPKVTLELNEREAAGLLYDELHNAVEKLCNGWEHNGLGWQTDTFPSKIDGCTNVMLYYGSSTYDTEQMSRLITSVVDECKEQGIETRTPEEIANLLSLWGE